MTATASRTTRPASEWTSDRIDELIAQTTPAVRYRSTRRFLSDPRDTATPNGIAQLLARTFRGELLSPTSTALLIEAMKATVTFPTRIKGLLPPGTVVAHKTGSTGTTGGLTAATNDSGVIYLPNGDLLALSVFLKASKRNDAERDATIARIARSAFDFFA